MATVHQLSWKGFRDWIGDRYCREPLGRRGQILFRGQENSHWSLQATIDRPGKFASDQIRQRYVDRLLEEFRRESQQVQESVLSADDQELLARHHGLPSPLLDWTTSPFIAAFFAFAADSRPNSGKVSIWMLDRGQIADGLSDDDLRIIDDHGLLAKNPRAMRQRSVFLRVSTIQQTVEGLLGSALRKIDLPVESRRSALIELDCMTVNSTYLFDDLTAAPQTARQRISLA